MVAAVIRAKFSPDFDVFADLKLDSSDLAVDNWAAILDKRCAITLPSASTLPELTSVLRSCEDPLSLPQRRSTSGSVFISSFTFEPIDNFEARLPRTIPQSNVSRLHVVHLIGLNCRCLAGCVFDSAVCPCLASERAAQFLPRPRTCLFNAPFWLPAGH